MSEAGPWRVAGVSARGSSHLKSGDPCQDAHAWRVLPCGTLVVAVADGAGTAALAELGAALAVNSALSSACDRLEALPTSRMPEDDWHRVLSGCAKEALQAVARDAANRNMLPRDLACTLLVAAVIPGETVVAIQIGDGAVVAREIDGEPFAVTRPAPGEYLNETVFLTSAGALESASFAIRHGPVDRLAVLTDGLQMLALRMPSGDPHPGFFDPLFRFVAESTDTDATDKTLATFLDSTRVRERADDDLTLVLAACLPSPTPQPDETVPTA